MSSRTSPRRSRRRVRQTTSSAPACGFESGIDALGAGFGFVYDGGGDGIDRIDAKSRVNSVNRVISVTTVIMTAAGKFISQLPAEGLMKLGFFQRLQRGGLLLVIAAEMSMPPRKTNPRGPIPSAGQPVCRSRRGAGFRPCELLAAGRNQRAGNRDHLHAGPLRREDAGRGVFQRQALRRIHT